MSNLTNSNEYIYDLPAAGMNEFTRVMDSLPLSDWLRFASQVISNQTELRLVELSSRRTETLMGKWGCRNGTVDDLLDVLQSLELLRPRDIILKWRHAPQPSSVTPPSRFLLQPPSCTLLPSSLFTSSKGITQTHPKPENQSLPKPGPPPPHLESGRFSAQQTHSTAKEEVADNDCLQQSCKCHVDRPSLFTGALSWPFEEVQQGTDNFSAVRQIGEGGFGHVYRASMKNTDFAVKRLKEGSQMGWSVVRESFTTEVERLSQYRHPNIVDLVGYSVGGGTYCLIYVYMPSGSLEDWLRCKNSTALCWMQRVNILLGSAKAIQYLHSSSPALIHGDVKSSNILLGEHLEPKLGDFGMARLCHSPSRTPGKTSTVAQTATVRGTLAYLPEEYLKDGQLGVAIDVYSFGVVVLEVLTGRRALETDKQSKTVYLKDLVTEVEDNERDFSKRKYSQETGFSQAAENICTKHLDPKLLKDGLSAPHGSREISQLACRCLDRRRKKRPLMTEVFKTVEDVYAGLKDFCRSGIVKTSPAPPHLSPPNSLRSDNCSLDSLTHRFSKLGPQEDTYCCTHKHSSPCPSSAVTHSQDPKSGRSEGSWNELHNSVHAPCESDESQGFSQCWASPCASQSNKCPGGHGDLNVSQSSSFSIVTPPLSSVSSDERVVINPVRQRFVEKMALYEEGRIPTSDLLSSATPYEVRNTQTREPEESDEFAS
ncbi:interleukin-1 receptor-associated kinase 1 isoform X2 [Electrophorus electricus]|uniref:interleukin-1 receptor-associated kinase 1 isoform X2 n=1 Tax=Electrophorus electricus TaxID=8005 RepID=UPI0015CFE901|nr:interleukin-1 receptor-associated kinase 1 isoform X2 [Electrophorus electricus]